MPPPLRLFVAIGVSDVVKAQLAAARNRLRAALREAIISWTRPENLHLTLRFLGDVNADHLAALESRLARAVAGFGSFSLSCERLGCFPDRRYPKIVWGGIRDGEPADRLVSLARCVTEATASFSSQPAKGRFMGHVTLARVRRIGRADLAILTNWIDEKAGEVFGRWTTESIELMQSELAAGGSRYTVVRTIRLN